MAQSAPNRSPFTRATFLIVATLAASIFLSCTRKAPSAEIDAKTVVATLYRDFAWEAVIDEPPLPGQSLIEQPRQILARYFDPNLVGLILKDHACVLQSHESCRLDFLPIWDAQDPGASNMKIAGTQDPAIVDVTFRYPTNGQAIELTYQMARTNEGWRVHDILSHRLRKSLLSILNDSAQELPPFPATSGTGS